MPNPSDLEHPLSTHMTRNVSNPERWITGIGGALLAIAGLRRGGLGGVVGALAGGALVVRAGSGYCPAYARLGATAGEQRLAVRHGWESALVARESIRIQRPREALYGFWRDLRNLPRVMSHVERVDVLDSRRSHWVIALPIGKTLEWDSEITVDQPNERIAWRSDDAAELRNSGAVEFRTADGGIGTELTVELAYEPPAGELGRALLKLWPQGAGALLRSDLEQLRRHIESGEWSLSPYGATVTPTSDASIQRH